MIEIRPPIFPLTREQFAYALAKGQGRARMHIERHGATGMEDLIFDACLNNKAYDTQIENDRPEWMHGILVATGMESDVVGPLVDRLARSAPKPSSPDLFHRRNMASLLARRGFSAARDAVYAQFEGAATVNDLAGFDLIQFIDGSDGLIWMARKAGQVLRRTPENDPLWT